MSGLRSNLEDWAQEHGAQVAAGVAEHEPATRSRIATGRRNRFLATGATAIAAVVGVVAIASALPGPANVEPATSTEFTPVANLRCGEPWTLAQGSMQYFDGADYYFDAPTGNWVATADDGFAAKDPSAIVAGVDSLSWQGHIAVQGNVGVQATAVAVQDGVIVGAAEDSWPTDFGYDGFNLTVATSLPGECGGKMATSASGDYTYHLVITVMQYATDSRPVAMIVDQGGPLATTVTGLETWTAPATQEPRALEEPRGDTYQAFAVRTPISMSCTPYQDMIDQGEPLARNHMEYDVTIPGVQAITGETWANEPAAIIDDPYYHAWYTDLPTAIVAEHFEGGNPLGSLAWTTGPNVSGEAHPDQQRLVNTDGAGLVFPGGPNCVFTLPVPMVSGAVYLIIDGVDTAALDAAYPGADYLVEEMQTWVYLGQAS